MHSEETEAVHRAGKKVLEPEFFGDRMRVGEGPRGAGVARQSGTSGEKANGLGA